MTRRVQSGEYKVGEVRDGDRYGGCGDGTFGVVNGKTANENGREEWRAFLGLTDSNWYAFRHFDSGGGRSICPTTHLVEECSTKGECVEHLEDKCDFDEEF